MEDRKIESIKKNIVKLFDDVTTMEGKYSMPIKQSYNAHIKESREHETHELLYEFLDDYSYSNAGFACFFVD